MATALAPTAALGTARVTQRAAQAFKPAIARIAVSARQIARINRCKRGSLQVVAVRVENEEVALGTVAPDFELPDAVSGKNIKLSEYAAGAPATLVMFLCVHCPFVVHLKPSIAELAKEYQARGVKVLAISSNSIQTHPQDGPDKMAEDAKASGYTFPFLYDESQDVAKAYQAACTPEFYVFGKDLELTYHGQYDSSRPSKYGGDTPVTGEDLRHALDCTLAGKPLERPVRNSIGCNIKWHPGKSPAWFHG
ncbi:hypothetical protein ABPG77_003315 [Micractinium sp. CCAP 211/92]